MPAVRALLFACALLLYPAGARADETLEGVVAPIVRVNLRQGDVTIRTWDRDSVAVQADPAVQVLRRSSRRSTPSYALPIPDVVAPGAAGPLELPAENFVVTTPPGERELIVVRALDAGMPPTPVVVTIPANSVVLFARTGAGTIDVRDYRGGTFVGFVGRGRMQLTGVSGTAFVQTLHGPTIVRDSSFERFRARSLGGNIVCERCSVRQIEASSAQGSIVFDDGSFAPGLARFESAYGSVAVGITGPAVLGGHAAADGRVYTNFTRAAHIEEREGATNAVAEGGGPVVTVMAQRGSVFFYDGALRTRPQLAAPWQEPLATLTRPGLTSGIRREANAPPRPGARAAFPDYRESGARRATRFR